MPAGKSLVLVLVDHLERRCVGKLGVLERLKKACGQYDGVDRASPERGGEVGKKRIEKDDAPEELFGIKAHVLHFPRNGKPARDRGRKRGGHGSAL